MGTITIKRRAPRFITPVVYLYLDRLGGFLRRERPTVERRSSDASRSYSARAAVTREASAGFINVSRRWRVAGGENLRRACCRQPRPGEMSALGHERTFASELGMSALPLKADMLSVTQRRPLSAKSGPRLLQSWCLYE